MLGSPSMAIVSNGPTSEAELARLYEYVEGNYRRPSPTSKLRRAVRRSLSRLLRPGEAEADEVDRASAPEPLTAVYLRDEAFYVPVAWCRNAPLFGFGPGAFDAWEATARQVAADPDLPADETVLARFLASFLPRTVAERMYSHPERDLEPGSRLHQLAAAEHKGFWPWSPAVAAWPASAPEELRLRTHGPVGRQVVELEVWRLKRLVASVKERGYKPPRGDGIRGQLLHVDGQTRFLVWSGFHRVAVLSALGHDAVPARFAVGVQRLMTLDQLPTWPLVREGLFTPREAELLVERLFTEDGSQLAARLGFAPHAGPAGR